MLACVEPPFFRINIFVYIYDQARDKSPDSQLYALVRDNANCAIHFQSAKRTEFALRLRRVESRAKTFAKKSDLGNDRCFRVACQKDVFRFSVSDMLLGLIEACDGRRRIILG